MSTEELLALFKLSNNLTNTIVNRNLALDKMDSLARENQLNREHKLAFHEQQKNYQLNKELTLRAKNQNDKDIATTFDSVKNYFDVSKEYSGIPLSSQTKDSLEILEGHGGKLNKDLTTQVARDGDAKTNLRKLNAGILLDNLILDDLDVVESQISDLYKEQLKVKDIAEDDMLGIVNSEDFQKYIKEHTFVDDPITPDVDESLAGPFPSDKPWLKEAFIRMAPTDEEAVDLAYRKAILREKKSKLSGGDAANKALDDAKMDVDSNILKERLAAHGTIKWTELPDVIQGITKPLNKEEFATNFLGKGVGYSKELKNKEVHRIFETAAGNIDRMAQWLYSEDSFKSKLVKDAYNEGAFQGRYRYGSDVGGISHLIGLKGKEGALIKKSTAGEWYVPQEVLEANTGLDFEDNTIGDANDKRKFKLAFEEELLSAKYIQDTADIDPLNLGLKYTEEEIEAALKKAAGY